MSWEPIATAIIGVIGLVLVELLRRMKTQATNNAVATRLDATEYADRQTIEHGIVASLVRESIANDIRFEQSINSVATKTNDIWSTLKSHLDSSNPHPTKDTQ